MTQLLKLVRAEFVRTFLLAVRYPLELFTGLLVMYLIFLGIFLGARSLIGGDTLEDLSLSSFIVGYLMWFFVISAISRLSYSIEVEAQQGVLEQIYLNYPRYLYLQFVRGLVDFVEGIIFVVILLFLISLTTGKVLHLDLDKGWQVIIVLIVTVAGINGFGLFFGGLALLFKRVGQVGSLTQFLFFLIAFLPSEEFSPSAQYAFYLLPLTQGLRLLKLIVVHGESLLSVPNLKLFIGLILNALAYLVIGSAFFLACEKKAKLDGRLGQY